VSAAAPAAPPQSGGMTHKQIVTILVGLLMGMFLASLDQTIVATAIRTIGDDLHGLSVQAWVTTAYLITSTISTPLYGKLSDLYGRKPFFLAAITIFVIGSAASSFATSMYMLAAFRAFQGLGAGGLFSLALAIIGDIVSPRERARYQGYFLAVFGTSSVAGPVIGGAFAGASSIFFISGWRWVFLVNVPIGIAALFVVWHTLNIPHTRRDHRIDWWGALSLVIGLVPLLIIAEQGRTWGWGSGRAFVCYVIGVAGLAAFAAVESRMGEEALIPFRFFRVHTFSLTTVVSVIIGLGMFGGISVLPLYLQIVRGATPTESGLLMLPMIAGLMSASILSGQLISRTGRYKMFPVIGAGLATLGLGLLATVGADTPFWKTAIFMVIFGLGLGNIMQPITLAIQNAVPPRDIGVATSSATFFRQMGATIGVAIFLSVLFSTAGDNIGQQYQTAMKDPSFSQLLSNPQITADPGNQPIIDLLSGKSAAGANLNDTSFLLHADKRLAHPFFVGFSQSMDWVFIVGAGVLAIAFVLLFFMREIPLRTQSGLAAQQEEAAAEVAGAPIDPIADDLTEVVEGRTGPS
jgi:EmrB/QacA subfamily drug resistance transporter